MKLTKLLAMLLALCMIICCFAACGGKDDDKDDAKDEKVEDKDDAKDEEDKDEDKDDDKSDKEDDKDSGKKEDAELEGRWKTEIDLGAFLLGVDEDEAEDLPELMFGVVFEFRNGNYTSTAVDIPSVDDFADFLLAANPSAEKEEAEQLAESLIDEIEADPRMLYGEYEEDGDVIILDDMAEVTFVIDGDEMTFEKIEEGSSEHNVFEGAKFEKQ